MVGHRLRVGAAATRAWREEVRAIMPDGNLYDALKAIERCDPDGGERQPTEADYVAHERWAVQTFGQSVWDTYRRGGWGEPSYA
ncbi:hypothetical protein [Micromonospora sp. NPDC047730]|uniref:hypothetical protein n=1 Tax=Micromonospora sp. NPDC047730 TaxID=3364253 RepID=UPI003717987A